MVNGIGGGRSNGPKEGGEGGEGGGDNEVPRGLAMSSIAICADMMGCILFFSSGVLLFSNDRDELKPSPNRKTRKEGRSEGE